MEELDLTQLWKELWGNKSPQKVVEGSEKRCSLEVWTLVDKSELAGGPGNQSHPQVGVRPQRGWCRNPRKVVALRSCHLLNSQGSFWRWIGSLCDSWPSGSTDGCSVRRSARGKLEPGGLCLHLSPLRSFSGAASHRFPHITQLLFWQLQPGTLQGRQFWKK